MSNQLQITGGAKVRNLQGVITGTSGVLSSVPLGGANGVATLDSGGKVPVSQLPSSVVTYLGTWDASTNTPTLTNGTGDAGDMYICNVAGTVNFGAGPITFAVGDWVLYGSGTWQKSNGQNGTVTSVGLTAGGNALTITNSPITTAGNINIGFAGSSTQYIAGDGTLVTFPTIITEAQTLITDVYNETGATLTKGTVVYINGGHGNLPTVTKALATSDATSAQTYGVVQADITNNNNGHVVVIGSLGDLDTQAYPAGTQLYLSSTTAGAWTSVKQYAPAHLVYVGIVVRSHPTQGVVEVKIQNGFELDELHNVSAQTPSNNQGIFYNSSNSLWENKSIATALGYTPADNSLVVHLAGTETITGDKTFSGLQSFTNSSGTSLQYGAYLTKGSTPIAFSSSTVNLYSASGDNNLVVRDNLNTSKLQFQVDASYTYTYPNLSGTLALLEGTQTFSGAKTFSVSVNNDDGLKIKLGSASNLTAGYLTLSAYGETTPLPDRTILRIGTSATQMSLFKLQNTGSYTYDFPASSGTLALTSNLSSYVPYTGATTNVDLGANNLTSQHLIVNGLSGVSGTLQLKQNTSFAYSNGYTSFYTTGNNFAVTAVNSTGTSLYNAIFDLSASTSSRTFTLPTTSGTIALTSNLSSYLPLTGGTLTGDLTLNNGAADGAQLVLASSGFSNWNLDNYSGSLRAYYGASVALTIASTGAATFSSSVNAQGINSSVYGLTIGNFDGQAIKLQEGTATGNSYLRFYSNTGGALGYLGSFNNAGTQYLLLDGSTTDLSLNGGSNLYLQTGGTNRLSINSTGAATFSSSVGVAVTPSGGDGVLSTNGYAGVLGDSTKRRALSVYSTTAENADQPGVVLGYDTAGAGIVAARTNSSGQPLAFWTYNGSAWGERARITSAGLVQIGDTVQGGISAKLFVRQSADTDWSGVSIKNSTAAEYIGGIWLDSSGILTFAQSYTAAGGSFQPLAFRTSNTERMRITSDGNVLINSTNNTTGSKLYINSPSTNYGIVYQVGTTNNLWVYGDGSGYLRASAWSYGSDARLKENISYIQTGLDKILALKPATFDYIDGVKNNIGWIAQDVQDVIPEAVKTMSEDNDQLTLKSDFIVPYLVKAIQEQQAQIQELKALINK